MTNLPNRITIGNPFCHGGLATTFPSTTNADTNLVDGFTDKSIGPSSGGVTHTVKREDFNEIGKLATKLKLYLQSGGLSRYDSTIGLGAGYPKGSIVYVDSEDKTYKLISTISNNHNIPSVEEGIVSTGWKDAGNYSNFRFDWKDVNREGEYFNYSTSGTWTKKYGTDKFVSEVFIDPKGGTGRLTIKMPNGSSYLIKELNVVGGFSITLGFVKKNTTIQFDYNSPNGVEYYTTYYNI